MSILVVHGYEMYQKQKLGALAETMCSYVAGVQRAYRSIILLGGWHLKEVGCRPTIGEVMAQRLITLGVPEEKMYTQFSLYCGDYLPPRDTMEEVDLLPILLRQLGLHPRKTDFAVACIWYFVPRIKYLYHTRGAAPSVISVFSWQSCHLRRMYHQFPGLVKTIADPLGQGQGFRQSRAIRTLNDPVNYRANIATAWFK